MLVAALLMKKSHCPVGPKFAFPTFVEEALLLSAINYDSKFEVPELGGQLHVVLLNNLALFNIKLSLLL